MTTAHPLKASDYAARLRATCSVLALTAFTLPGTALALPAVFASQSYTLAGASNTVSNNVIADVLPVYSVGADSIFGHTYANPSGFNGSRSSGTNNFAINGTSTYEQFFTNGTGLSETVSIPFEVTYGEVATSMASSAAGTQTAGVEARIGLTLNGATSNAFDFKADMGLTSDGAGTSNLTFALSGTPIGGAPLPASTAGVTSGTYFWSPYDSIVSVVLQPGDTLDFLYTLTSYATGSMTSLGNCQGTGFGGQPPGGGGYGAALQTLVAAGGGEGGGNSACYNAAIGRIGDPFNPSTVPQALNQAVPEPMSATVFGAGLAALAFNRRRRVAR